MTINYTNKIFDTLWIKRPATLDDLCRYKQETQRNRIAISKIIENKSNRNRHKYWYCVCTACQKIHIVSSNYLNHKVCKCQKKSS